MVVDGGKPCLVIMHQGYLCGHACIQLILDMTLESQLVAGVVDGNLDEIATLIGTAPMAIDQHGFKHVSFIVDQYHQSFFANMNHFCAPLLL